MKVWITDGVKPDNCWRLIFNCRVYWNGCTCGEIHKALSEMLMFAWFILCSRRTLVVGGVICSTLAISQCHCLSGWCEPLVPAECHTAHVSEPGASPLCSKMNVLWTVFWVWNCESASFQMGYFVTWRISRVNAGYFCGYIPPLSPVLSVLQNWLVEVFDFPTFFGMQSPEDEVCNLQDTQQNHASVSYLGTLCMC